MLKPWRTFLVKGFFVGLIAASMLAQWSTLTFLGFFICLMLILLIIFYERVFPKRRRKD